MKTKRITIEIQSLSEGLKEFAEATDAIQRGTLPSVKKEGIYFTSIAAMRRVLTPKRFELLRVIRQRHPDSVYELSRLTNRDLKNVQDDVNMLARGGLVRLSRAKEIRDRVTPRVDYDRLHLQIPVK